MNRTFIASALLALVATAATPLSATGGGKLPPTAASATAAQATSTWIVVFEAPPLAGFTGAPAGAEPKLAALAPTSPLATGAPRLDVGSPAAKAYRAHLKDEREALVQRAGAVLGRPLAPAFVYDVALNGMAVDLSAAEADALRGVPGVRSVAPEFQRRPATDAGPAWIRADAAWNAPAPLGNRGEGVVVGIIDSGINRTHPSFAETGPKDGYRHANPLGRRFGRCATTASECNDKLIGIYDYSDEAPRNGSDLTGHGSHVAGTAVGNALDHSISLPGGSVPRPVSGVAPHANLISYKACRQDDPDTDVVEACRGSWLIEAIDQAVADGVDIINYSIGGSEPNPWNCVDQACDADEEAMLNAFAAGVLSVVAAGNEGPGTSTVTTPGNAPWVLTVANATHDRAIVNRLVELSGGTAAPPGGGALVGAGHTAGSGFVPIVIPTDHPGCGIGSELGLGADGQPDGSSNPWASTAGNRFNGEIVVCERGTHARVAKSDNVRREGAGGFVLVNTAAEGESVFADAHSLPGTHLGVTDGNALLAWLRSGSGHRARIEGSTVQLLPERADMLASSSGRGPALFGAYLLPDVSGPGSGIIAAASSGTGMQTMSGTSMATPHVAGAAALLKSAHPGWSPSDLASALVGTARDSVRLDDGTAATVFEQGAGMVDAGRALRAGLGFRATASEYRAADPGRGGDPKTLNEPALVHDACFRSCTLSRRVNDLAGGGTWQVVADMPTGASVVATPAQFTLASGASQTVSFRIDVDAPQLAGDWIEGRVRFERVTDDDVSSAEIPVAVFADPGPLPAKASVDASGEAGHRDITLSGLVALPDARFGATALAETVVTERDLSQDPTRGDPYDSFAAGAFQRSVVVPAGAGVPYRLLVEATSDTSSDIDLFVGQDFDGNGAGASEVRCTSATASASERCLLTIEGAPTEQTFWIVVQNYSAGSASDPVRMESTLFDMRAGNDGTLVATGPGHVDAGEAFDLRIAWDDPTMTPGAIRRGYVLLGTSPERVGRTAALLVEVRRSATGAPAAVALRPGMTRRMELGGGAAQDRLYVDVPANAASLTVTMTGVGNVDLYAAHAPGATGPVIAAAPPRSAAQASSTGTGASESVTVSGAALAPGRWYITPVNTGSVGATVNLTVTLGYDAARAHPNFGAWFNEQRSGTGAFLYEAGGNWAVLWYAFLQDGTPTWYLGAAPKPDAQQGVWTVPMERYAWSGVSASATRVGEAVLTFADATHFTFSWNIDGDSGSEPYTWIDGGACPDGAIDDLTGSWFAPAQPGYGFSINAYAGLETNAAYFYDDQGVARWVFGAVAPFGGDTVVLSQYQGPCPLCPYSAPVATPVGSFVRGYSSDSTGSAALDIELVAPLSGSWSTSASIDKLTGALGCQ